MDELPTHLDLFTGLAGFAIAAQAAGFRTVAMCESEPRCQRFLKKTWGLPVHPDVHKLDGRQYRGVSLLTGGPPCQPASRAGKQGGAGDDRWLWPEALRILDEAEPDSFVFENPLGILDLAEYGVSPPLASDGSAIGDLGAIFDRSGPAIVNQLLDQIESRCYEVQPIIVPACALDSPQLRERIWFVGFMADTHKRRRSQSNGEVCPRGDALEHARQLVAESAGAGREGASAERDGGRGEVRREGEESARGGEVIYLGGADGDGRHEKQSRDGRGQESARRKSRQKPDRPDSDSKLADSDVEHGRGREHSPFVGRWGDTLLADAERERRQRGSVGSDDTEEERSWDETFDAITRLHWEPYQWTACSDGKFRRTPDEPFDVAPRLHRSVLAALGNAVLPQAAFPILYAMSPLIR